MNYYLVKALDLLIIIPAIIALLRVSKINSVFYPFLYSIWLGTLENVFSSIIVEFDYYNTIDFNIWLLLNAYVVLWLFKNWNLFDRSRKLYGFLIFLVTIVWTVETIFLSKLAEGFNSYFRILFSFMVILMSINTINSLLMRERKPLLKNPVFLICSTFVLFNTIAVVAEAFFASNLQLGDQFRINMDRIIVFTSLLCNLIYALAILWMPKKQAFILQY